jgi:hypothetical protein
VEKVSKFANKSHAIYAYILWKQLSPSNIQWSYWQLIEFWRFVYIMKLYGFGRFRPDMSFVRFRYIISKIIISSIWHQKGVDSTYNLSNDLFLVKQLYVGTYVFKIFKILEISSWFVNEIMILEMIYLTGGTNTVFATICDISPYVFEFSPFVWHLTQFFWCDNVCIYRIFKILEISSWFVNEIMILEMIYRNRTKDMSGRNL